MPKKRKVDDYVSYGETHDLKRRGYGVQQLTSNGELWCVMSVPVRKSGTSHLSAADLAYVTSLMQASVLAPEGDEQERLEELVNDVHDRLDIDEATMQKLCDDAPKRESFE